MVNDTIARYNQNRKPPTQTARPRSDPYFDEDDYGDDEDEVVLPSCICGAERQTVRHMILECLDLGPSRRELIRKTGTSSLWQWLNVYV